MVVGAAISATAARGRTRRAVMLVGGVIAAAGLAGIVLLDAFVALVGAAMLFGVGGIIASSSGAALLADATHATARPSRFGQQIALGTMAAFFASALAGILAEPVAAILGAPSGDVRVLRTLVAGGGMIAALSALPIFFIARVPVSGGTLEPTHRYGLLARFLAVEVIFGLGAGSFLPFTNLFFADRFGIPFATLGLLLGAIAVAGSLGALAHGRYLARRYGAVPSLVGVVLTSIPFALLAAATGELWIALLALSARAFLMYGSSATWNALTFSSFTPRERAGVNAVAALAWNGGSAIGAVISGAVRGALGPVGYSVNLMTLVFFYAVAAALIFAFFRRHEPTGDVGALGVTAAN